MLGLDTNVLVRFVQDDQAQFERAQKLIGRELRTGGGVLISLPVLLETEWVLRSRYSLAKVGDPRRVLRTPCVGGVAF